MLQLVSKTLVLSSLLLVLPMNISTAPSSRMIVLISSTGLAQSGFGNDVCVAGEALSLGWLDAWGLDVASTSALKSFRQSTLLYRCTSSEKTWRNVRQRNMRRRLDRLQDPREQFLHQRI